MKICEICDKECKNGTSLAGHIGMAHKMTMEQYVIQTGYGGIEPKCKVCDNKPSFVRGKNVFRNYCKEHANLGRAEWSKENMAFDPGWKKGLTKETNDIIKRHSESMKGEKNHFYKNIPRTTIEAASRARKEKCVLGNKRFKERANQKYNNNFDYSQIEYEHSKEKIKIHCNKHNIWFYQRPNDHLSGYNGCPRCSNNGVSKAEKELADWIKTTYSGEVIENTRVVISPKELDIYIPEKNFAIEYNGLYWHSADKVGKKAHAEKTKACAEKGIKLFHIFSDEWQNKRDIVKSMIQHRLNRTTWTVFARKCEVKQIDKKVGAQFLQRCHISGDNRASAYFGLFYGETLKACLSLKKPIQKKYSNSIEIARFATELYTTVPGGFSKLLKNAKAYAKENGFSSILTYADTRFGTGEVYEKNNFSYIGQTPIDYWYTNGEIREFRFKYRASKPLAEAQVAQQAGVWPVYGCGSRIYLKYI